MSARYISLQCLKQPVTLSSIGLLLFNDHILKFVVPSWLTGKLSDFAGLFFFPFLLAFALSFISDRWRISAHRTGQIAIGLTALWFILIKISPASNLLTKELLWRILGIRSQIILDPTDLIALSVLLPTWRMWTRSVPIRINHMNWLALSLASLATLGTSGEPPYNIQRVIAVDDVLYAGFNYYYEEPHRSVVTSVDGGRTWKKIEIETAPKAVVEKINQDVQLPVIICEPANTQICYRITGQPEVDESRDGGQNWQIAWEIPLGRRYFIQRIRPNLDPVTTDMSLLQYDNQSIVIVTMGYEGALVRDQDGIWRRYPVITAYPTPYAPENAFDWLIALLFPETFILLSVAFAVRLGLTALSWVIIQTKMKGAGASTARWWLDYSVLLFMVILFFSYAVFRPNILLISVLMIAAILITLRLSWKFVWTRVAAIAYQPKMVWRSANDCASAMYWIFLAMWLPYLMWVADIIQLYEIALVLSVLLGIWILMRSIHWVSKASRLAGTPVEVE